MNKQHFCKITIFSLLLGLSLSVSASVDPETVTVFNTSEQPITVTAVLKSQGFNQRPTTVLSLASNKASSIIKENSMQDLILPNDTIALFATPATGFPINSPQIPFTTNQDDDIVIFSMATGKPELLDKDIIPEVILLIYNETTSDKRVIFITRASNGRENNMTSFLIPAGRVVSLPCPDNAHKFAIGEAQDAMTSVVLHTTDLPKTTSGYVITPRKGFAPTVIKLGQ